MNMSYVDFCNKFRYKLTVYNNSQIRVKGRLKQQITLFTLPKTNNRGFNTLHNPNHFYFNFIVIPNTYHKKCFTSRFLDIDFPIANKCPYNIYPS